MNRQKTVNKQNNKRLEDAQCVNKFKSMSINMISSRPSLTAPTDNLDFLLNTTCVPITHTKEGIINKQDERIKSLILIPSHIHPHHISFTELYKIDKNRNETGNYKTATHNITFIFATPSLQKIKFIETNQGLTVETKINCTSETVFTTASLSLQVHYDLRNVPNQYKQHKIHIYDIDQPANLYRFFKPPNNNDVQTDHYQIKCKKSLSNKQILKIINPRYNHRLTVQFNDSLYHHKDFNPSQTFGGRKTIWGPLRSDPIITPNNYKKFSICSRNQVRQRPDHHTVNMLSTYNNTKYASKHINNPFSNTTNSIHQFILNNELNENKPWENFSILLHRSDKPIQFNILNFICNLPEYLQTSIVEYVHNSGIYISHFNIRIEFLANSNFSLHLNSNQNGIEFQWKKKDENLSEITSAVMDNWQTKTIKIEILHHYELNKDIHPLIKYNKITSRLINMAIAKDNTQIKYNRMNFPTNTCPWTSFRHKIFDFYPDLKPKSFIPNKFICFNLNKSNDHHSAKSFNIPKSKDSLKQTFMTEFLEKKTILSISHNKTAKIKILHIDQINHNDSSLMLIQNFPVKEDSSTKIFSEIIISDTKMFHDTVGLVDSGADVSLIHINLLKRIFTKKYIEANLIKSKTPLSSFSNHSITTLGVISLSVKFHKYHDPSSFSFIVYSGNHLYQVLLGQDIMKYFRITLSFNNKHEATLAIKKDKIKCFASTPESLDTAHSTISLKAKQSKIFYFKINPAFTILHTEKILIEEQEDNYILIPASLSPKLHNNMVAVLIINKLNKSIFRKIRIHLTTISKYHKVYNKDTLPNTEKISVYRPIIQNSINTFLPTLTINNIQKSSKHDFSFEGEISHIRHNTNIPKYDDGNPHNEYPSQHDVNYNKSTKLKKTNVYPYADTDIDTDTDADNNVNESSANLPQQNNKKINIGEVEKYMTDNKYLPLGYEVPDIQELESLIDVTTYPKLIQPYIKKIFLEKYPSLWSTHNYDIGQLSKTLGHCSLQLKKDVTLPPFKKLYYVQEEQRQHLSDILSFLLKHKIIQKANQHDTGDYNLFASPGYLVKKANPSKSSFRLIVDFTYLNSQLITSPPIIPNISQMIESLQGKYIYSTFDLTNAFFSIDLDQKSQLLTKFATTEGSYIFKKLVMGLKNSPFFFTTVAHNMVHCAPVRDKQGNLIMVNKNMVKLEESKLENVIIYFDDLIICTPFNTSYKQTLEDHFKLTDKLMSRLHTHNAKLSPEKSVVAQTTIKFLGWVVSNNFLIPDKKRTDKLKETPFPATKTGIRAFCGLLQTLKQVIPGQYLEHVKILSPLTSPNTIYKPDKNHHDAFNELKDFLTKTPLFCKLINPLAKMWLFTDACTGSGSHYGAVLLQEKIPDSSYVPEELNISDPIHEYIHLNKLSYEPLPFYFNDTYIAKTKCEESAFSPIIDISYLHDEKCGLGDQFSDSLLLSLRSILYYYKCKFFNPIELKREAVKILKKSINLFKLKSEKFNGNMNDTKEFLDRFIKEKIQPDESLYLVEAISEVMKRKFIIIFPDKIVYFNESDTKPPIILGIYFTKLGIAFRPFRSSLSDSFDLNRLKNRIEITYFYSKLIPAADRNKEILSLEALGLLHTLSSLKHLIKISNLTCITDSKPLFLIFSKPVHNMHSKVGRYCLRIQQEFPELKLRFIKSADNLSDFLSRSHKITVKDAKRLPLKYFDLLPEYTGVIKENYNYTLDEWQTLVDQNTHLITNNAKSLKVNMITGQNTAEEKMSYLAQLLYDKSNQANIIIEQEAEFKSEISKCKIAVNFEIPHTENSSLKLINGVLYLKTTDNIKILLPESLISPIICLTHLSQDHIGLEKMVVSLSLYHIKNMNALIRKYLAICFDCFLNNHNKGEKFGLTPLATHVCSQVSLDLAEDLAPDGGFRHILVGACQLSNLMFAWPIKSKTASQILQPLLFNLFQFFQVRHILTDGGPCFREKTFRKTLKNLNIQHITPSAYSPWKNGLTEKFVGLCKGGLKKYLTTDPKQNWVAKLPYIVKSHNTSKNAITGYSPLEILYGASSPNSVSALLKFNGIPVTTPMDSNSNLHSEIKEINEHVHKLKTEYQKAQIERKNKHRIEHKFAENDYVFLYNRSTTQGVSTQLRSKYSTDVYIVETMYRKSFVAKNLATGQRILVAHDHAKRFNKELVAKLNVPQEIVHLYSKNFDDLTKVDRRNIAKVSPMTLIEPPSKEIIEDLTKVDISEDLEEDNRLDDIAPSKKHVQFEESEDNDTDQNYERPRTRSRRQSSPLLSL